MKTESTPEFLILNFLKKFEDQLRPEAIKYARQDAEHNECDLAYDAIISEIESSNFTPSPEALIEIKKIESSMNIKRPKSS
ncbi:MafI family immunity protein [Thauera sp.]|uniref:MafI family immunity protein n=1 Tax=Thauera sp. TaxID=1905334 RepID=UPI0039E290A1